MGHEQDDLRARYTSVAHIVEWHGLDDAEAAIWRAIALGYMRGGTTEAYGLLRIAELQHSVVPLLNARLVVATEAYGYRFTSDGIASMTEVSRAEAIDRAAFMLPAELAQWTVGGEYGR